MNRRAIAFSIVGLVASCGAAVARADDDVIAIFKLKGALPEAPPSSEFGSIFGGPSTNMFDLLKRLNKARNDSSVKAIVLELDEAAVGFAQVEELRAAIEKLKAADKDVWVYAETLQRGQYALASAATKIVMMPAGELVFNGLYGDSSYYKNMLDHIGVQADIVHIGDYKSAGEPFYRTGPSKEADEQTNRLLDGIFERMVEMVAESRKLDPSAVRSLVDTGMFSPKEAVEAGLVDELMFKQDFRKTLQKRYGSSVEFTRSYGKDDDKLKLDLANPMAVFTMLQEMMGGGETAEEDTRPSIGVVYVESMITSGKTEEGPFGGGVQNAGSDTVARALDAAREDDNVKAVILRVDSPGGSAIASDVICEALVRCQQEKPVVVSMGNVAGSGGYYVACMAKTIFAEPTTITGSIGVVGGKMVTRGLWDWVGVTSHEYKRGARSDLLNGNRMFSDDERKVIRDMMLRVYGDFKGRVMIGRGDRIKQDLEQLAGGRVYTGKQALEIGLVDKLGGFWDAIRFAKEQAELDKFELKVFPEPKTFADILGEAMGREDEADVEAAVAVDLSRLFAGSVGGSATGPLAAITASPMFAVAQTVDPARTAALAQFLRMVETLGRERVLLADPSIPFVR